MSNIMSEHLKDFRVRSAERTTWDIPSAVLHKVPSRMELGLDEGRVRALADFIEGLERIAPLEGSAEGRTMWAKGPIGLIKSHFDRKSHVTGYMLRPKSGGALGLSIAIGEDEYEYILTGNAIIQWAWGWTLGMNAVAKNGFVRSLESVLTADPVFDGEVPGLKPEDVTLAMVADALRDFTGSRDVLGAWRRAAEEHHVEPEPEPEAPPVPMPEEPARVNGHKVDGSLTAKEAWKGMMMREDYTGAVELCERQVAELELRLVEWRKRHKASDAMASDS